MRKTIIFGTLAALFGFAALAQASDPSRSETGEGIQVTRVPANDGNGDRHDLTRGPSGRASGMTTTAISGMKRAKAIMKALKRTRPQSTRMVAEPAMPAAMRCAWSKRKS